MAMNTDAGRPAYTDEEQREAQEWLAKLKDAEEKHRPEIKAAMQGTGDLENVAEMIHKEIGPMPPLCRMTIPSSLICAILQKEKYAGQRKTPANVEKPSGTWICGICGTENSGNFCMGCGNKR